MSVDRTQALSNNTTNNFLSALVVNGALLGVEVGAFLILKKRLWRIYSPRTILPPPDKRAPQFSGMVGWLPALIRYPTEDIIDKNGLDAYMFLRYLKLLIRIFLIFTLLTFAVIIPADATGITSSKSALERISWTNIIEPKDQDRFFAHIVVVYILTFIVIWMIRREMSDFIHLRQQFLLSHSHSRLPQARTVLITSVPDELAKVQALRTFGSFVPGGVDRVWLFRDTKALNELFERRQQACGKLEGAETALLEKAVLAWRKKVKSHKKAMKRREKDEEGNQMSTEMDVPPITREFLDELVPQSERPCHRTGVLGMIGQKVDTIEWCRREIAELNEKLRQGREHIVKGRFLGSAFIRCNLQLGAHVLAQCLSYHEPLRMQSKWMEANPKDIVWHNLDDGALEMRSRKFISWGITIGLIIAWAFPVGFIGTLSNLDDLCLKVHWLDWLCRAKAPAPGIIQGVLPPAFLAGLFALLPLILRALAWYEGIPRYSLISVSVYRRFYFFLLIHGFLIVTLTSGITRAIQQIVENPTHTVQELASQLPGASVFFLTYMITQGLSGAGAAILQLGDLVLYFIKKWFLGRTPRQAYGVSFLMPSADFGVILPRLSLLATIGFAYSALSPLINLLALLCYVMFYIAWKFLFVQVFDQADEHETGGLYFPMAIDNLFVGLYIEQISLACLFFLKASGSTKVAIAQAAVMLVLVGITAIAHSFINHSYKPLIKYLPMSLATQKLASNYERRRKHRHQGVQDEIDNEVDLFSRTSGYLRIREDAIVLIFSIAIRRVRRRIKKIPKTIDHTFDKTIGTTFNVIKTGLVGEPSSVQKHQAEDVNSPKTSEDTMAEATGTKGSSEVYRMKSIDSQMSRASHTSRVSKTSKKSKYSEQDKEKYDAEEEQIAARPSLDPPPSVMTEDTDEENEDGVHAFDHPSTYVEQPWIWIPKDKLGISRLLVQELEDAGVKASDLGAEMREDGIVEVSRNPPDEDWSGGHDA
ncbi:hypothetical protein NP233_g4933 [Leucocoprinus birnbaumii]|uniref:DUF221-domain-containing protein n=1 Tax=Leucocoprinus birnbaumii TaxID=56174 RepID=A0AAD5YSC5_9AGAR|nr:hypothetical protein NP233_g4933 [Leucocoprinus birnbaumii]